MTKKVLLATGNNDLDGELQAALSAAGKETAGPVYYKEALQLGTVLDGVEAVVISPALSGSTPVNEVILSLRKNNLRVILLAGEGSDELRQAAIGMGVYDIIDDPVQAADVVESVLHPVTFAAAVGCKPSAGHQAAVGPAVGDQSETTWKDTAKVRRCLEQARNDAKVIAVYSPTTDSGKTLIAVGLAETLAFHGVRTAFLDLDLAAGDATQVFRLADGLLLRTHPTVATWRDHPSFPQGCLMSESGVCVLPRAESFPSRAFNLADVVPGLSSQFEATVADLGVGFRQYEAVLEKASARLLVSDCDDKALFRIGDFLRRQKLSWTLLVNLREKKCKVSPEEVIRTLSSSGMIRETMVIPYLPGVDKMSPGTFRPDSLIAEELICKALGAIHDPISGGVAHEEGSRNLSRH